ILHLFISRALLLFSISLIDSFETGSNLNSEFVRAFTGILHIISERFTRYFIMTADQKIYNWIMNYNKLREVKPVTDFDELKEALELDSLIQEFEF
ncbi:hypothetical protein, partial [Leptospira borgpetersenii]|uniref:hypothetical protein n=1 Tax=Leptospira borgpetersenii TaxID=174 RepID=UPI001D140109